MFKVQPESPKRRNRRPLFMQTLRPTLPKPSKLVSTKQLKRKPVLLSGSPPGQIKCEEARGMCFKKITNAMRRVHLMLRFDQRNASRSLVTLLRFPTNLVDFICLQPFATRQRAAKTKGFCTIIVQILLLYLKAITLISRKKLKECSLSSLNLTLSNTAGKEGVIGS